MTQKTFDPAELGALAAEACNLWQEHLTACASDPTAHAEMLRLLEPQRQIFAKLFADYTAMMQTGGHAARSDAPFTPSPTPAGSTAAATPPGAASAAVAFDDGALRLAQLAHRMATLEQHIAELEQRLGSVERKDASPDGARPAERSARKKPDNGG